MGKIYTIDSEKKLILYTSGSYLFIRTASGNEITKSTLLCNDYAQNLSSVIYHGTIYYSYQNQNGDFLLRSILDPIILYQLSSEELPDFFLPTIFTFNDHLHLLYFIRNPLDETYILKIVLPFEKKEINTCHPPFSSLPYLHLLPHKDRLLISCHSQDTTSLFCVSPDLEFTPVKLYTEAEEKQLLSDYQNLKSETLLQINQIQEEHSLQAQQIKNTAELTIKQLKDTQKQQLLSLAQENMQQLNSLQSELENKLLEKEKIISSITEQYETLMQTALKYKDEASKWYNKFCSRKP